MSEKIMLPMSTANGRVYATTLSEQQSLARRYGLSLVDVKASLGALRLQMLSGEVMPQATATKTRKIIDDHFRKQ